MAVLWQKGRPMLFLLSGIGVLLAFVYGSTRVRDEVCFALNINYESQTDFLVFVLALLLLSVGFTFPIALIAMVLIHFIRERP